jgi:hypothetical protein
VYSHRFRRADERTDAMLGDALFGGRWAPAGYKQVPDAMQPRMNRG